MSLTHGELADVMRWKLKRGKMRPLQKRVEANREESIVKATSKAFQEMATTGDVRAAMKHAGNRTFPPLSEFH